MRKIPATSAIAAVAMPTITVKLIPRSHFMAYLRFNRTEWV
jgi:hypothetical protein